MNGKWREIMAGRFAENALYLLTIFNCFGYMVLFVVVIVWLRLMLHVVEDALSPLAKKSWPRLVPIKVPAVSEVPDSATAVFETRAQERFCA